MRSSPHRTPARAGRPAPAREPAQPVGSLLRLQRAAGNVAVGALLTARGRTQGGTAVGEIDAALAVTRTGFDPDAVAPPRPQAPTKRVPPVSPLGKAAAKPAKDAGRASSTIAQRPAPAPAAAGVGATPAASSVASVALTVDQVLQPPVPPTSVRPEEDPAFARVTGGVTRVAHAARAHPSAASKAQEAQHAAVPPSDDRAGQAKAAKVDTMDAQQAGTFDKKSFIAAVKTAIEAKSPKTLKEADEYKESGKAGEVKGEVQGLVGQGAKGQAKDIETATHAAPDESTAVEKPVTPMAAEESGQAPTIPAEGAAPKPAPVEQLNLAAGKHQADRELADAGVTEQQLARSNEPRFQQALADKRAAAAHADTAPAQYRQAEGDAIDRARADAAARTAETVAGMHGSKQAALAALVADKGTTKSRDEQQRAEVTAKIQGIYAATEAEVTQILEGIGPKVDKEFTDGEAKARRLFEAYVAAKMFLYKRDRYGGWLGGLRWAKDKLFGMPDEVNEFYAAGRELYLQQMDGVISRVADVVGGDLAKAKQRISDGKAEITSYVTSLPTDLRRIGAEASREIGDRFGQLESDVNAKQQTIIDGLATKYVESRKGLDERITALQAENKGLVNKVIDGIKGVVNTIRELGAMLRNVLSRAAGVVGQILQAPSKFLDNLIAGVKGGIQKFRANIAEHLRKGLLGWLFGSLAEAGVEIPETFDFKGVIQLLASVFGLTWANIRGRIVRKIGEKAMGAIEKGVSIFQTLASQGVAGLWQMLLEKLGNIKDMILERVKDFVITKIITAGITWLLSLLNPAAAFIKACKLIYDIVMFFVNNAERIAKFFNTVIDSMADVVRGNISGVVEKINSALGQMVPVLIGFLASILGIGGIGQKLRQIIKAVQKPVTKAVDSVVKTGLRLAGPLIRGIKGISSKVMAKLRGGDDSPEGKQKRLDGAMRAGVAATNRFAGRTVGNHVLRPVLGAIKMRYGLSVLEPVPQGRNWAVYGEIQRAVAPTKAFVAGGATPGATPVDTNDPGEPAHGIGDEKPYGEFPRGASLRKGPRIHHIEREHIIPFAVGKRLWQMVNLAMPGRGGHEDKTQTTIMIYKGAADLKYPGDKGLWNGFEAAVGRADIQRRLSAVRTGMAAGLHSARTEGTELVGLLMQGLRVAEEDAITRTNTAITEESQSRTEGFTKTNAERRGPAGQPEPPTPKPEQVSAAATRQYNDVVSILKNVLDEVNEGRTPTITPPRRKRR